MGVINVTEDRIAMRGPVLSATGMEGERVFTVLMDGADDYDVETFNACGATGVPRIYQSWRSDIPYLRVVAVTPQREGASHLIRVTCQYRTGPLSEDPLTQPTLWDWGDIQIEEDMQWDADGKWVANTAGELIEGMTRTRRLPVLTLTRSEASYNGLIAESYKDTVNLYDVLGFPAGTLWMADIMPTRVIKDIIYWRVAYKVVWDWRPRVAGETQIGAKYGPWMAHQRRVPNMGTWYWGDILPGDDGYDPNKGGVQWGQFNFTDPHNRPLPKPVPLTADGQSQLGADESGQPYPPIWLYFQDKVAKDWSPLRFG